MHAIATGQISNETGYLSIAQGVLSVMCGPPSTKSCAHLARRHYPYRPISTNNAFLDAQSSCFWNIQYLKELTCLATTGRGARPSILSTRLTVLSILTSIIDMSSPYTHKFQVFCKSCWVFSFSCTTLFFVLIGIDSFEQSCFYFSYTGVDLR